MGNLLLKNKYPHLKTPGLDTSEWTKQYRGKLPRAMLFS